MDQWTNGLGESNEMALDASLFASPESFIRRNPSFLRLSSHIMFFFFEFLLHKSHGCPENLSIDLAIRIPMIIARRGYPVVFNWEACCSAGCRYRLLADTADRGRFLVH